MVQLRSVELAQKYKDYRKALPADAPCPLCTEPSLEDFMHWRIINNNFPYDLIAAEHHMLVPRRHITEDAFTEDEAAELKEIKKRLMRVAKYDWFIEATQENKSIPEHFHLHLVKGQDK